MTDQQSNHIGDATVPIEQLAVGAIFCVPSLDHYYGEVIHHGSGGTVIDRFIRKERIFKDGHAIVRYKDRTVISRLTQVRQTTFDSLPEDIMAAAKEKAPKAEKAAKPPKEKKITAAEVIKNGIVKGRKVETILNDVHANVEGSNADGNHVKHYVVKLLAAGTIDEATKEKYFEQVKKYNAAAKAEATAAAE